MGFKYSDIAAALLVNLLHVYTARSEDILPCDVHVLYPCPSDQYCNGTVSQCMCKSGLTMVGKTCVTPNDTSGSLSGIIAFVVILMLVLLIGGLVLVVRKYNLIEYARERINARRNNEVMYEDVMIGQDDPPLSP